MIGRFVRTGFMPFILIVGTVFLYLYLHEQPAPETVPETVPENIANAPAQIKLELTSVVSDQPEEIPVTDLNVVAATHADMHGCFRTELSLPMLTETYHLYDAADPITPAGALDCFDAETIRKDMQADIALAFLARADVVDGLDRVVVIYDDGRAFVWNQPNMTNE